VIPIAIGLGLAMSLVFSEAFGLAAGGMVVPGYIAVALADPPRVVATVVAAILTFLTVRLLSQFMLLYGRRHLVMVILIGFLFGYLSSEFLVQVKSASFLVTGDWGRLTMPDFLRTPEYISFESVGYIIPGLIAYWMERQGALQTLMSMFMAAAIVRLILIVALGGQPIEVPTW